MMERIANSTTLAKLLFVILLLIRSNVYASVVELTDYNFETNTQASTSSHSSGSWFLLFKSNSCGHCERVKPTFEELAKDEELVNTLGISFGRVDVPSSSLTSTRFSIRSFPSLIYLHENRYYIYKGKRTYENLKMFLLGITNNLDAYDEYEYSTIPAPMSELDQLYQSLFEIHRMAKLKGGVTGGYAVITLFGTGVIMLVLAFFLSIYLVAVLLTQKKVKKN